MTQTIVFIGPTDGWARTRLVGGDVTVAPPAERGDVADAVARGFRRIVLVDGLFHHRLSVGHRELRDALARGLDVIGLSSIGALRAVEMAQFGMRGFGVVHDAFAADPELPDDEVALLHAPTEPYVAISEPMFHLRSWLVGLEQDSRMSTSQRDEVVETLRGLLVRRTDHSQGRHRGRQADWACRRGCAGMDTRLRTPSLEDT